MKEVKQGEGKKLNNRNCLSIDMFYSPRDRGFVKYV
jgi:hypothetical protein